MTPFTPEQRAELRASIDRSQREARAESKRLRAASERRRAEHLAKSEVVRAAEHAQRASQAKEIAKSVVAERPRRDECQFCGAPAKGGVCLAHSDLLEGT